MATTELIVDDQPVFRSFAREHLEGEGFQVVRESGDVASSGAAGFMAKDEVWGQAIRALVGMAS